ncbi:MAG: rhamnulokinase [Paludibacteraceae bacterium]|nr:rhamnulokinase [Paludibacteraceae bacterium]
MTECYCAIDLGATSGRIILSEDGRTLTEVCRFPNRVEERDGKFFWNITRLFEYIQKGLQTLSQRTDIHILSIGIDTWGVDICFLDAAGRLLSDPRAYRDPYTVEKMEQFFRLVPKEDIYRRTGIQFLNFNTLYQLYACHEEHYQPFEQASTYLFIPDYITYLLTGRKVTEYTILSTSQLLNPHTKQIDNHLLSLAGGDIRCFPPIVYPGTEVGLLRRSVADFGYDIPVIAVAGHDTASAVATVARTYEGKRTAFLNSGTWSLMGTVCDEPIINEQTLQLNFTNEGGIDGTTRLLKNITGMWLIEQCRKEWSAQGKDYSHSQLIEMAQTVTAVPELFNPDDVRFANPSSMISEVCHGRQLTDKEIVSCIFHSLANRYSEVFRMLQSIVKEPFGALFIIGGGARNAYLNRLTEEAVGVPVIVGEVEATAAGNISVQIKSNKHQL